MRTTFKKFIPDTASNENFLEVYISVNLKWIYVTSFLISIATYFNFQDTVLI